jgi:hypothetical protein
MPAELSGWRVPITQALALPLHLAGVKPLFLVGVFLGTLLAMLFFWRLGSFGLAAYGLGCLMAAWEPEWLRMLWRYWWYQTYYEG